MSVAEFNPDSPCVAGLQWFPDVLPYLFVAGDTSDGDTLEHVVTSSATETVSGLAYFTDAGPGAPLDLQAQDGLYSVEVYNADSLGTDVSTVDAYAPDFDVTISAAYINMRKWTGSGFVTSPLFDGVDSFTTFTPGSYLGYGTLNDTFITPTNGLGARYEFQATALNFPALAGEAILGVRVVAIVDQLVLGASSASASFTPYIVTNGLRTNGAPVTINGGQPNGRRIEATFYSNPQTGCPWSVADANQFGGGLDDFGIEIAPNGDPNRLPVIYSCWGEILHRPESRVAWGCLTRPGNGWNTITLQHPDGTPGWAKVNGTRYLTALRRRGGLPGGRLLVPVMFTRSELGILPPVNRGVQTTYNLRTRQPSSWAHATDSDATAGLVMVVGAGVSADSQPYATMGWREISGLGETGDHGYVNSTRTIEQTFVAPSTASYGFVRLLVKIPSVPGGQITLPNGSLQVTLKNGGGTTLAGPITFTTDDLVAPYDRFQVLKGQFAAAAALTSGTTYRLVITSSATDGEWLVQTLSTLNPSNPGGPPAGSTGQTFGGTTGTLVQTGAITFADACITLAVNPGAMAGLTATASTDLVDNVPSTPRITVAWTQWVPNCGTFAAYELERSDDGGTTYNRIANITDVAAHSVVDYEPIIGVATKYRVRAVRVDGAHSAWAGPVTATANSTRCGFWFSSNAAPTFNVWYDDNGGIGRDTQFLENVSLVQLDDRDAQVGFRELEDRRSTFDVSLLIADNGGIGGTAPAATHSMVTFDPLLVLAGSRRDQTTGDKVTVPYVCVRTKDGDRWLAMVTFPRAATRIEPYGNFTLLATVTEVTDTPYPFDAHT